MNANAVFAMSKRTQLI